MPAEWEPHASTWLAWPHLRSDWPDKFEPIPWVYAEIVRNLARHERVDLIVNSERAENDARSVLERANALSANVVFHRWRTDRGWMRDSGCLFITASEASSTLFRSHPERSKIMREAHVSAESKDPYSLNRTLGKTEAASSSALLALHFQFNAWAKYDNYKLDAKIGARMAKTAAARVIEPTFTDQHSETHRVVLEGGSIDINGRGTLLTTEECLLSKVQERNAHMTRVQYEKAFADYLGCSNTIWLGRGIAGDDTHGHVDDLTRFVSKDTVVTMIEHNASDENHAPLLANLRRLQAACDQDGRQLTVVEIPMPQPVAFEGRRLPASYANFYIANGIVLVPVFNRPNDRIALNTLAQLFPTREIVPIYSGDFIWGLGAMHCMTQQQPA